MPESQHPVPAANRICGPVRYGRSRMDLFNVLHQEQGVIAMNSLTSPMPRIPRPMALPLGLIPDGLHSALLGRVLNHVFATELAEGGLDFLEGRTVGITVRDAGIAYGLQLRQGRFFAAPAEGADLTIEGNACDYLLLVTDREDADTLFFQRRLGMSGSTELGVHLKNFLAGIDPAELPLPEPFMPALERFVRFCEGSAG